MKTPSLKGSFVAIAALCAAVVAAPSLATAQPSQLPDVQVRAQQVHEHREAAQQKAEEIRVTTQQAVETNQQRGQEAKAAAEEHREKAQGRLKAAKLKACEKRQDAILNIMTRISDRGAKQLEVFTTISDRTQAFYVKQGRTLTAYDALVADVESKKAVAEAAVAATSGTPETFSCDGDNPKGVADTFKDQLKAQNSALNDYKLAIKNLIVGVKSAQSTDTTKETSEGTQE